MTTLLAETLKQRSKDVNPYRLEEAEPAYPVGLHRAASICWQVTVGAQGRVINLDGAATYCLADGNKCKSWLYYRGEREPGAADSRPLLRAWL
jgi:hypothetical protein